MNSEPPDRGEPPRPRSGSKFELVRHGDDERPFSAPARSGDPLFDEGMEGLEPGRLLHLFWRKKWWIALAGVLGIAAGAHLYRSSTPVYQTHSSVWVESGDDGQGPIQAEEVFEGQGWSDLFTSLAVLEPVARETDLHLDAETRRSPLATSLEVTEDVRSGRYHLNVDSAGRFVLRYGEDRTVVDRGQVGDSIGTEAGLRWAPGPDALPSGTEVSFSVQTPARAAAKIQSSLSIAYNAQSGSLITARLSWDDSEEAARILNETVRSFLDVAHDLKTQKLRETLRILEQQTRVAEERLTEAELAYENARVENVTLPGQPNAAPVPLGGGQGSAGSSMDPYFQAYFERRLRSDQLQSDLEQLESLLEGQARGDSVDVIELRSVSSIDRSTELQQSLDQVSELRAERRSLLLTYTEEHPRVQEVTDRIRRLSDRTIPEHVRDLAEALRSEIDRLEGSVQSRSAELRDIPPRLIQQERLRRDMQQAEQLHSDLLQRLKSAELALATTRPNLQVVDRAQPPGVPASDQGPRLFLMASLAGFGLGIGGVIVHDQLDDSVREPDDIEDVLGLPILGLIPSISPSGRSDHVPPGVLESFRTIRAQLNRSARSEPRTVVVTSPEPRDGKSLVAANLAISFASSRRSTLLIDGDMRRGNVHQLFDLPPEPGLADYLAGDVELSEIIRTTEVPGLLLVTRGDVRGFDLDRLEGPELDTLFERVRRKFDAVICDSPPLGAGSDALLLGEECDQALLVLRTGATEKEVTRARLEATMYFDFPLVGAVLNDVPDSAAYNRYYSSYEYLEEGEMVS